MRKFLLFLMVAGLLLTFSTLFRVVLKRATGDRPDPGEATRKAVDEFGAPLAAQSSAPDVGRDVSDSAPKLQRADVPESDSLSEALISYDELYQGIFAQKSGSGEEYAELGRRRRVIESLLVPRITRAVQRKYQRRPSFQDYPVVIDNVVDIIYTKPCRGCVNIDYEILARTNVIGGMHCPVKMTIAREPANDEAFVQNADNYCFEPITHPTDGDEPAPSGQP